MYALRNLNVCLFCLRCYENRRKKYERKNWNEGAACVAGALLLVSVLVVPAVSADEFKQDGNVGKLVDILEQNVNHYNRAVIDKQPEKIIQYVEKIDQILKKLSIMGYAVDFDVTSQITKNHDNQMIPTSVRVTVRKAMESDRIRGHSLSANEEQLRIINQLNDQDISVGDFLKKVFPEILDDMPQETTQQLLQTKMPTSTQRDLEQSTMVEKFTDVGTLDDLLPIVVHPESHLNVGLFSPVVDFGSSSRVWFPHPWYRIPYMSVATELKKDDGTTYAYDYDYGYNVYEVSAGFSYSIITAGYYQTKGGHIAEVGPLYFPPVQIYFTETDWTYINP